MLGQFLHICEIAFVLIAACSGLVAAWFELRDRWQTDAEREKTKVLYGKKWEAIRDGGLLQLPEKAVMSALELKTSLANAVIRPLNYLIDSPWSLTLVYGLTVVAGAAGGWITNGWIGVIALGLAPAVVTAAGIRSVVWHSFLAPWVLNFSIGFWTMTSLVTAGIWLNIVLGFGIAYAAIIMLTFLPLYILIVALPLGAIVDVVGDTSGWKYFEEDTVHLFGMAIALSFFVTLCSLLIGNLVAPDSWIPKTLQMLLFNVVFDGLTMVATIAIIARAVGEKRKYPIPVAILIDVVVAALFASASLWLGLIGTEHALSIKQVLGVLIAKSAEDTVVYAFGPFFWAMHTTFLPTLAYMALILLFWIAKLVVLPIAKVLKKGPQIDKPHSLMAGLFLFVVAVAMALAGVLHVVNDVPTRASAAPAQVVEDG